MAKPDTFSNRIAEEYPAELAASKLARIPVASCPGETFDQLVADGDRLVFIVTVHRELVIAPQIKNGFEVRHSVLAGGLDVLAAGEVELVHGGGMKIVLELTNKSGHYEPDSRSLEVAAQVFEEHGYTVPSGAVRKYPGE